MLLTVAVLGVVDYLTGDYSLVIFYLIPLCLVTWICGRLNGLLIAVCCVIARVTSDFSLYGMSQNSPLHYWNFSVEALLFIVVAALVATLKKAMDKEADH